MTGPIARSSPPLRRELGLVEVTLSGVGIILGAGIYVLIGEGARLSGNALWAAFVISAAIAFFTCMSYAELSSMFPKAGAEYDYVGSAFSQRLAFVIGLLVFLSGILAATTVALGFAGYVSALMALPVQVSALGILLILTVVLLYGVKETARVAVVATLIEVSGLVLIIALGIPHLGDVNYLEMPLGFSGLLAASALIFFAYQGFESMVKFSEEARNPEKTVPRALILALTISTAIYILVALSAVSLIGWQDLGASDAPFSEIVGNALGPDAAILISGIALFATGNTVLLSLYASTRILYGMAGSPSMPGAVALVLPGRRTPWVAILVTTALAVVFIFSGDIAFVANVTNFTLYVSFIAINATVIVLRFRSPGLKRPFRIPFSPGGVPLIPVAGLVMSVFLLSRQDLPVLLLGAALALVCIGLSFVRIPGDPGNGNKNEG
ncbi:MAG: APC family permease [Methanoregulaceae archaeon]|nr:APC family permease [Methanoregulaceae archaeon]